MSYRSEQEVAERLLNLELQNDLYRFQIHGCSIWRFLKFSVALQMMGLPFGGQMKVGRFPEFATQIFKSMREIPSHFSLPRADYFVSTFSSFFQKLPNGTFRDSFFDDYLEVLGSAVKMERVIPRGFVAKDESTSQPVHFTSQLIDVVSKLATRIVTRINPMHPFFSKISAILRENEGLEKFTPQFLASIVQNTFIQRKLFRSVLRSVAPKAVLISDTGDFGLACAAFDLGIPVIEFQHGVFTRFHPDALHNVACKNRRHILFRSRIFLYGEYWKKQLDANEFYSEELRVVGSSRIDLFRKRREHREGSGKTRKLLVTMQNLDTEKVLEYIRQILKEWKEPEPLEIFIKLHPLQETSKELYEKIFGGDSRVKILLGWELPSTYDLMVTADFHMSIASACHYEALGIGVPTVVLPFAGHEVVQHLCTTGHATLAEGTSDLVALLRNPANSIVPFDVSRWYYQPGAVAKVKSELQELF